MEYSTNALLVVSIASLLLSAATASSLFTIPRAFSADLDFSSATVSAAFSPSQSPASSPPSLPIALPDSETTSSSGLLSSLTNTLTSPLNLKEALPAVDPAVKSICDQTDFSFLCVSSLLPYLVDGKLDPVSILGKEIKAAVDASERAVAEVNKMVEDQSTPDDTKTVLKGCIESYGNAVDNLKKASAAMEVSDIGQANSMLSAAITSFTTCEEGFEEDAAPGAVSPTQALFDPLEKMTSNCLAIVGSIQNVGV